MFALNTHALTGQSPDGNAVAQVASPNHGGEIQPKFLVFHYTACDAKAAGNGFIRQAGASSVSAHLLVDTTGAVTQYVPLNRRAWHAGNSEWLTYKDLNTHSIGIEIVNYGYLLKTAAGAFRTAEASLAIDPDQVVETRHRHAHFPWQYWHAFTPAQVATCEALAQLLVPAYGLLDVLGHDDIAPTRKSDPGPAFPIARIRSLSLGRNSEIAGEDLVYVAVEKLNIRNGPGTDFAKAGPALVRNSQIKVLSREVGGWLRVVTSQQPAINGWVMAAYTAGAVNA